MVTSVLPPGHWLTDSSDAMSRAVRRGRVHLSGESANAYEPKATAQDSAVPVPRLSW